MKNTLTKKLIAILLILSCLFSCHFLMSNNSFVFADGDSLFEGSCRSTFLGLTSWDCGVKIVSGDGGESLTNNGIWLITIIASYLVIGYVIYGGYLYMFSSGEASKVAAGKKTLLHAFIGLAIVMSANIIMNTIRFAMLKGSGNLANCATQQCVTPDELFINGIQWVIGIAGIVAAIFVVIGGISYITSTGDPGKLQKAKDTILYALIGLIIVALAELITSYIAGIIQKADSGAFINETTISKEVHENHLYH